MAVGGGDTVFEDHALAFIERPPRWPAAPSSAKRSISTTSARTWPRCWSATGDLDEARPDAVARRRKTGQRTTRENIDDLCDPGNFTEYGALTVAARRHCNAVDELILELRPTAW